MKVDHLPKIRCSKYLKEIAYKLAQKRGISYAELVRHLILKENES